MRCRTRCRPGRIRYHKEFMSYFNVTSDMTTPFTVDYSFVSVGMLGDSYKIFRTTCNEDGSLTVYADYFYKNPSPVPRIWSGHDTSGRAYQTVSWTRAEIKDMSTDNAGVITITQNHKLVCRPTRGRGGRGGRGL